MFRENTGKIDVWALFGSLLLDIDHPKYSGNYRRAVYEYLPTLEYNGKFWIYLKLCVPKLRLEIGEAGNIPERIVSYDGWKIKKLPQIKNGCIGYQSTSLFPISLWTYQNRYTPEMGYEIIDYPDIPIQIVLPQN